MNPVLNAIDFSGKSLANLVHLWAKCQLFIIFYYTGCKYCVLKNKLLLLIIYSYLRHKRMAQIAGGRIKNDNGAIIRISGRLSSFNGAFIFGCFGICGKLFLRVPVTCGDRHMSGAWIYH